MAISDFIGAYAEGWTEGDATKIIDATAPNYVFDDPNAGQMNYVAVRAKVTSLICRRWPSRRPRTVPPFGAGGRHQEPV